MLLIVILVLNFSRLRGSIQSIVIRAVTNVTDSTCMNIKQRIENIVWRLTNTGDVTGITINTF